MMVKLRFKGDAKSLLGNYIQNESDKCFAPKVQ